MATIQHKHVKGKDNHVIYRWRFATETQRAQQTVADEDIGKVAWTVDTNRFYVCTGAAPATWALITPVPTLIKGNFVGALVPQVGSSKFFPPDACRILQVYCSAGVAGAVGSTLVDVKCNGQSVMDPLLSLPAGQHLSQRQLVDRAVGPGDWITIDIVQAAQGVRDLVVYMLYH